MNLKYFCGILHLMKIRRLLFAFLLFPATMFAYETDWTDKKIPSAEAKEGESPAPNSRFKLDGQLFLGYEFLDHGRQGTPDASGPAARIGYGAGYEPTGFQLNRAYLNFRGETISGPFKGWSYRVTTDIGRAGLTGNSFTSNGSNNEYTLFIKYAYVNIPLFDGASLRLGQQHVPLIAGQAGVDLEGNWEHRYVDLSALEFMNIAASADRGLAFIYKNDYLGVHTLLANGEGFRRGNAQNLATPGLDSLPQGTGDSYGLTSYSLLSVIPTGANKTHRLSVNVPLRFDNVTGIDKNSEDRFQTVDLTTAVPTATLWYGDTRAKRDRYYGTEVDYTYTSDSGDRFSIGVGRVEKVDLRGSAYKIDNSILTGTYNPADPAQVGSHIRQDSDAKGIGNYIYVLGKIGQFGAYLRLMTGTSGDGTLNGQLGTASSRSWTQQMLGLSQFTNGNPPTLYQVLNPANVTATCTQTSGATNACTVSTAGYDPGKSRFRTISGGITWHATPNVRFTVGFSTLVGTDRNGNRIKDSALSRITNSAGATAAAQMAGNPSAASQANALRAGLGLPSTDPVNVNYLVGKNLDNKQVFIRSEILF